MKTQPTVPITKSNKSTETDLDYAAFEKLIARRVASANGPLFLTKATDLFDDYLSHLPKNRQHYNCNSCRRFIAKYGPLVTIAENGERISVLWELDDVPTFFIKSVKAMRKKVMVSEIDTVFVYSSRYWGLAEIGGWSHLHGLAPVQGNKYIRADDNASMAIYREDFQTLKRALKNYNLHNASRALQLLESGVLIRSEKALGVAQWFVRLHKSVIKSKCPDSVIWLAVATAPPQFCHINSGVISTLLDGVVNNLSVEAMKDSWAKKMNPLEYLRPKVVKEGTIVKAEKIVEELKSAGSLERRSARLEDVTALWTPKVLRPEKTNARPGPVFGHLIPTKAEVKEELPLVVMTWDKFRKTVLDETDKIELLVPAASGSFVGLTTAVSKKSPPILRWDGIPDMPRNPVGWYFYASETMAHDWSLVPNSWCDVTAICLKPSFWHGTLPGQEKAVFFLLQGCKDSGSPGSCLFPEMLNHAYHEIRSVIEKHSSTTPLRDKHLGSANGVALSNSLISRNQQIRLRLTSNSNNYIKHVKIDRWD